MLKRLSLMNTISICNFLKINKDIFYFVLCKFATQTISLLLCASLAGAMYIILFSKVYVH